MKLTKRHTYFLLLLIGVVSFATGIMDIDWMLMQYHNFGTDAVPEGIWYFKPPHEDGSGGFGLDWWYAYVFTIARIAGGMFLIGYTLSKLRVRSDA